MARAPRSRRSGADDYLTKDVSLPHLLARIAALFRRAEAQAGDRVEVAVASGEENDRQCRRHRAQLATERETAVDVGAQADVDERQIRQTRLHGA
jgi:DNA-binding response OmpR family regulator